MTHSANDATQVSKVDPVCGMTVRAEPPPDRRAEHDGQTYWFCSTGCRRKFVEDPASRSLRPRKTRDPIRSSST